MSSFRFIPPEYVFAATIGSLFQFHELQQLGNAFRGFGLWQVVQRAEKFEVFPTGEKTIDGPFLRYVADELPDDIRLANRVVAQDAGRS